MYVIPGLATAQEIFESRFGNRRRPDSELRNDEYLAFLTGWLLAVAEEVGGDEVCYLPDKRELPENSFQQFGYAAYHSASDPIEIPFTIAPTRKLVERTKDQLRMIWTPMTVRLAMDGHLGIADNEEDASFEEMDRTIFSDAFFDIKYDRNLVMVEGLDDTSHSHLNYRDGFERGQLWQAGKRPVLEGDIGLND